MNRRTLLISAAGILCIALLAAAFVQHGQLADLRADQKQLFAATSGTTSGDQSAPAGAETPSANTPAATASAPSSELLQLRNQVSQLTERKRQLFDVRAENERLRSQLAARGTNAAAGAAFPPGYIRTSQAQWAGMNTPESTIRSFLWVLRNHDLTNLLQVVTPESAQDILRQGGNSTEELFTHSSLLPGMRIISQEQISEGVIGLHVEIVPGAPPQSFRLRQIGGEWKIDLAGF